MTRASLAERLHAKLVESDNGCLEWTGAKFSTGYGTIGYKSKNYRTHRVAWELEHGAIPVGMFVCHRCDNPACCRVSHLFLGTHADNMRDMAAKGRASEQAKTHCPRGHPYDDENTILTNHGSRACRECSRQRCAERYARTYQYKRGPYARTRERMLRNGEPVSA